MKPSHLVSIDSSNTITRKGSAPTRDHAPVRPGMMDRAARRAIFQLLGKMKDGRVEVIEGSERTVFGADNSTGLPTCTVTVFQQRLYSRMLLGGTIGAAESYMDGDWTCSDLTALIRILIRAERLVDQMEGGMARLTGPIQKFGHWLRANTLSGSRKNIAAHYDLSNDFFALFLDETMMYSSAYFEHENASLFDASMAKNQRLCNMLKLAPGDHLLEIGTGWGGFAIHAAKNFGCRVTTTTISKMQHALATERIAREGLSDRIDVLLEDYRELKGQFDKLVSIEMIEAVGHNYLNTFFKRCGELLNTNGAMALQAITIPDNKFKAHSESVDFIKKHIFPGSCLPSVARMLEATKEVSDLNLSQMEEITPHYARTLRTWRERFFERIEHVRRLGFNETFIRMWEFYLCYCEAGFAERYIGTVQMLFAKPGWRV